MSYEARWVLLVVRTILPGTVKPLAEVDAEIAEHISEERRRLVIASFVEANRAKWTAGTSCRADFVVQKCSQYHGPPELEANPLAGTQ